ncbi:MAG TPA: type II secretion system protein GspG [Thermoanaerobaculia bacterium]|jgi:general secretion pathway protein G|nr:type II secretion system protein GspG [Thermoanaerobaculia bacterium]
MSQCPHCGAAVAPGAQLCGACGRPLVPGVPRSDKSLKWVVMIVAGAGCALVAIAVAGIVAALIIPNFLDALQKAKQKRTVGDLRTIATTLESYRQQNDTYPAARGAAELGPLLAGQGFPGKLKDGWQHELRYTCLSPAEARCASYELASPGRDGAYEHPPGGYTPGPFAPTDYDRDLVMRDGDFVRWPQAL